MTNRDRDPFDPQSGEDGLKPSEAEAWRDLVSRLEEERAGSSDAADAADAAEPGPRTSGSDNSTSEHPSHGDATRGATTRGDARHGDPGRGNSVGKDFSAGDPAAGKSTAGGSLGGPRDYSPPPEPEGFVPEDPPPLTGAQPLSVLAWIGAVGAPLALLFSALFWRSAPLSAVLGLIIVFIASAAYLIVRLPSERDNDDDGAVV